MISWIQDTFKKHMTLIFVLLLAVIVVPFVFTIGRGPGIGTASKTPKPAIYYGYNLRSPKDLGFLQNAAMMSYLMQNGMPPFMEAMLNYEIQLRPAFLHLADQMGIPAPSKEQFEGFLKEMRLFQDNEGKFDAKRYEDFLEDLKANPEMDEKQLALVVEQDYRIRQVSKLLTGPAVVLPEEVAFFYKVNHTFWTLELATLPYDEQFKPNIQVDEAGLEAYYQGHRRAYAIAPKVEASYVVLDKARFEMDYKAPSQEELEAYFKKNKGVFAYGYAQKNGGKQPEKLELETVKGEVLTAYRLEKLGQMAQAAAYELEAAWFDEKIAYPSEAFDSLLQKKGLQKRSVGVYSPGDAVKTADIPPFRLNELFNLAEGRYYGEPFLTETGACVLLRDQYWPEEIPQLAEVRERVERDYREERRFKHFEERAQLLSADLQDALKKGESLEKASASLNLKHKALEPFTLETAPRDLTQPLFEKVAKASPGQLVGPVVSPAGATFALLKAKRLPEMNFETPPESYKRIEEYLGYMSTQALKQGLTGELIRKGMEGIQ